MIYLLYGQDTYRSWQKLQQLRQKYVDTSKGDTDLIMLDGADLTLADFISQTQTIPLLANRRLVIIKNLLREGSKDVTEAIVDKIKELPTSAVIVFYEAGLPDRRTKLFQALNQPKQAQAFEPLVGPTLTKFVVDWAVSQHLSLPPALAQQLINLTNGDLWRIHHELIKLQLYKGEGTVTEADLNLLVSDQPASRIFDLTDAFGQRQSQKAVALLQHYQNDDNHLGLLAMIAGHYRNLLLMADGQRQRINKDQLASRLKLHPYVFDKSYQQAQGYTFAELVDCYHYLFELDLVAKQSIVDPFVGLSVLAASLAKPATVNPTSTSQLLHLPRLTEESVFN